MRIYTEVNKDEYKTTMFTDVVPNSNITREQMAVILYNYANKMGFELSDVQKQIIFGDHKFDQQGIVTRAEVATVLN